MTCRVARLFQKPTHITPVNCDERGQMNLEEYSTSQTLGLHRCPICAQSIIGFGIAKELGDEPKPEEPEHY